VGRSFRSRCGFATAGGGAAGWTFRAVALTLGLGAFSCTEGRAPGASGDHDAGGAVSTRAGTGSDGPDANPTLGASAPTANDASESAAIGTASPRDAAVSIRPDAATPQPRDAAIDDVRQDAGRDAATIHQPSEASVPTRGRCEFDVNATLSEAIATVGVVTFTTTWGPIESGHVEFGPTTEYGTVAPVELGDLTHRTLMLGMTANATYHYRIVAEAADDRCTSEDRQITTGPLPETLPLPASTVEAPTRAASGFLVTSVLSSGGVDEASSAVLVIFDESGRPVWWSDAPVDFPIRTRLSWDGRHLYSVGSNRDRSAEGTVFEVSMEGTEQTTFVVPTSHHDLSPTPDGDLLFLTRDGTDGCDRVTRWSADGTTSIVFDVAVGLGDAFLAERTDPCHCNSIHYSPIDETITLSCLNQNTYMKIDGTGKLLWVLGGNNGQSYFDGDGAQWEHQHGHQMVTADRILFFNNGATPSANALAIEVELDTDTWTATRVWSYQGDVSSPTLGDVQRLRNGNTLVTYSNAGVIHEVDRAARLVRSWSVGHELGYVEHRETLYGPPSNP
jgi:hypothetical protein